MHIYTLDEDTVDMDTTECLTPPCSSESKSEEDQSKDTGNSHAQFLKSSKFGLYFHVTKMPYNHLQTTVNRAFKTTF